MSENATQNGNSSFVVDDLLNMIVPFEFPFEGSTLKGRWYKYKTNTPSYAKRVMGQIRELQERFVSLTTQIKNSLLDDAATTEFLEERDRIDEQLQRTAFDWMADALVEWNAVGRDGEALPISRETLDTFPLIFLGKLNEFLSNERTGQNPTSPTS